MDAFEQWALREIRRLREEADVLQLALDRFMAAQGLSSAQKPRATANPTSNANHDGPTRRSKYESLFVRWADASREHPITYADMEQIALEEGIAMERNLLRSTVHAQKQIGRVRAEGDGYVWAVRETETASPDQEDAAS